MQWSEADAEARRRAALAADLTAVALTPPEG
jgi:hypothetical protein